MLTVPVIGGALAHDRRHPEPAASTDARYPDAPGDGNIGARPGGAAAAPSSERANGHEPAPRQVRRIASDHGGSPTSRWVAEGCDHVAALVRDHGLPDWMTSVAWRESRCRHDVTNFDRKTADRSYGLFQINVLGDLWRESRDRCGLERPEELLDARVNVACAAALYRAYGYRPWNSGTYFSD